MAKLLTERNGMLSRTEKISGFHLRVSRHERELYEEFCNSEEADILRKIRDYFIAAYAQARVAVQTIRRYPARFDAHWVPRCLHTHPPIGAAGWTAEEAHAAGQDVGIISETLPLITDDDATMVEPDRNLLKLIVQSGTWLILGCQAVGSRATELINLASSAIRLGLTVHRLADLSFIHPSASEAMIRVLQDHFGRSKQTVA